VSSATLSVIVLAWNQVDLTERCLNSIRSGTTGPYELIVVDNGSEDATRDLAAELADKTVVNESNLGFAAGHNRGLEVATGSLVAFANNDTVFPAGWDGPLVDDFDQRPAAGIVLPAVTAAGNPVSVRAEPGETVEPLLPFGEFPSGVVYLLRTEQMRRLGGWNEQYRPASAEDLDLAFTVWAHGLDVILDTRTLIEHQSQASMRNLPDLPQLYRRNLEQFLDRWDRGPDGPLLDTVDEPGYLANLGRARTAVRWIRRMLEARDETAALRAEMKRTGKRRSRFRPS
jgi:GT2 family glycosyltransferase